MMYDFESITKLIYNKADKQKTGDLLDERPSCLCGVVTIA